MVKQATGDFDAASANYLRALDLHRRTGSRLGEAQVLNHLGGWSLAAGHPGEALPRFEQALAIAKGVASRRQEARALEGLGRCQAGNGRTAEAVALLRAAVTIYQDVAPSQARRVTATLREFEP